MFSICKNLFKLTRQIIKPREFEISSSNFSFLNVLSERHWTRQKQNFHTSTPRRRQPDVELEIRKARAAVKKAFYDRSEADVSFDSLQDKDCFPTVGLYSRKFDGVPFRDLPIVHITVTKNNTTMSLSDGGAVKLIKSCGREGFKNARKGTNIAAQVTGNSFGRNALKKGYKTVRVLIKGLGPGRLSGIRGIQLAGMNIVSITDATKDSTHCRPRKQRRI